MEPMKCEHRRVSIVSQLPAALCPLHFPKTCAGVSGEG